MNKERPFSPEIKESPPVPGTLDLILINGKLAQCKGGNIDMGVTVMYVDDKSSRRISPEEWSQYDYEAPPLGSRTAQSLVENGLMNSEQLQKVHYGREQDELSHLRGLVKFFGAYTKRD
ncbi:hypothetical protein GF340_00170 [Candidatus Peregrinibacteria bacterium]|nr:hypothetical protein [Candidatus Peregrinibacteria bacterium]